MTTATREKLEQELAAAIEAADAIEYAAEADAYDGDGFNADISFAAKIDKAWAKVAKLRDKLGR